MKTIFSFVCCCLFYNNALYASDVPIFVLKKSEQDVRLERILLKDGENKQFAHNAGDITVISSQGGGRSGDFIRLSMGLRFIAHNQNGTVVIKLQQPNGNERVLQSFTQAEMHRFDIRVNVTSQSMRRAFVIHRWETVVQDSIAPVMDMFQGKIPMIGDDYALTTETIQIPSADLMGKEIPVQVIPVPGADKARYLMVRGSIAEGSEGLWVLDLAAASSIVARRALPKTATVEQALMKERSAQGQRSVPMTIGGAGGAVTGLGVATLPVIRFGNIQVRNEELFVADSLPRIAGQVIDGILGMDILRKTDALRLEVVSPTQAKLCFTPAIKAGALSDFSSTSFSFANGHLFVRGEIPLSKGTTAPVTCLFDSGSPHNFAGTALEQYSKADNSATAQARGLDGNVIQTRQGILEKFDLALHQGTKKYSPLTVKLATLPVISSMGANMPVLLLGNDFLLRHSTIVWDFTQLKMYIR